MLDISRGFVSRWSREYDERFKWGVELQVEMEIRQWLARQPEPKYLDKEHFVRLGWWKARRQMKNYRANAETSIKESTRSAYEAPGKRQKIDILTKTKKLRGVGTPEASTILHFLHPNEFPIFDVHVRSSLKKAGKWKRDVKDQSVAAYLEDYIPTLQSLSGQLGVSLRELDKALWAYDKWG